MMHIKMSFTQSNLHKYLGLEHYCTFELNLLPPTHYMFAWFSLPEGLSQLSTKYPSLSEKFQNSGWSLSPL